MRCNQASQAPLRYGGRWLKYKYGQAWRIDHITLPQTCQGKRHALTVVEAATGWLETYPVPHATAWNALLGLEKQVRWRHGTPERIESDNRTHFRNNLIDTWAKEHGKYCGYSKPGSRHCGYSDPGDRHCGYSDPGDKHCAYSKPATGTVGTQTPVTVTPRMKATCKHHPERRENRLKRGLIPQTPAAQSVLDAPQAASALPREKPALTISGIKSTSGKVVRTARPLGKEVVEVDEDIASLSHVSQLVPHPYELATAADTRAAGSQSKPGHASYWQRAGLRNVSQMEMHPKTRTVELQSKPLPLSQKEIGYAK
ncbi:LOW QUALITY PROTEIN: hypothetical protein QYF61_027618, partial [Mycteria americana]